MKVKVDFDLCEANAVCMDVAPEVFKVDDDDNLHLLVKGESDEVSGELPEGQQLGVAGVGRARVCPSRLAAAALS